MKQTKKDSFIEAVVNTAIGFLITMIMSPIIYGVIGAPLSWKQMGMSTFYFTVLSISRGYIVRRWFNGKIFKLKKEIKPEEEPIEVIYEEISEPIIEEVKVEINPKDYIKEGVIWIDKDWGDTEIKITKISDTNEKVRFIYLKLDGKSRNNEYIHDHDFSTLLHAYKPKIEENE